MPEFVRAQPQDAAAIRAFVRAAYAHWVPLLGREPLPMTADYDHALAHHVIDFLVADGGRAGLIELTPEPGCILIENVAVSLEARGKGYGRALLAHAADFARERACTRLRLYTNALMTANIALYRRLGYGIDCQETTPDGRNVVHMSMTILPPA